MATGCATTHRGGVGVDGRVLSDHILVDERLVEQVGEVLAVEAAGTGVQRGPHEVEQPGALVEPRTLAGAQVLCQGGVMGFVVEVAHGQHRPLRPR